MDHGIDDEQCGAVLSAVDTLLPLAREHAARTEQLGRLPEQLLAAIFERRLFRLWIPLSVDGEEFPLVPSLSVFERIAGADGSTGWTVMIGVGAGLFAGFLEPSAAREIYGPSDAVVAGSGAASGTAREVPGGYRVSGRWSYGSGAPHATWFTANCVVQDAAGNVRQTAQGNDLVRAVAVPAADVTVHPAWSVAALRGTASEDFEFDDCFVPAARTFSVMSDLPREGGPLYRFPFFSIAELSFSAVSLGIARHGLEEFRALSQSKRPSGHRHLLKDDPDVQSRYARAAAMVQGSRARVFELAQFAWDTVAAGRPLDEHLRAEIRLAAVDAVARSAEALDLVYQRAGMTPLFTESALGRAWRDVHAVSQNMAVSSGLYVDTGRVLLGG